MLRLFAGRPLLILNGEKDPNNPLGGAELAFASAKSAYREKAAEDRLQIEVATGVGHQFTREHQELAMKWFDRWLLKNSR